MKRILIISLILLSVIAIGVAGYFYLPAETYNVADDPTAEVIEIKKGTLLATVDAAGQLEAIESVNLNFDVSGTVAHIYVSEGDRVTAGTLIAELETDSLSEAVELAEIDLLKAQIQLEKLQEPPSQLELDAAQASVDSAKSALETLLAGPTETDIKSAQVALDSAKANLYAVLKGPNANSITVAKANLRKAEIALRQAQQAYDAVAYDSRAANFQGVDLERATIDYEAALANYNLSIGTVENADILAAQARVASAEATLQKLIEPPTATQLYDAQGRIAQAETTLQNLLDGPAETDIAATQANVDTAQIRLKQAQRNLEQAKLYSPIAGVVTTLNIEENSPVSINNPVAASVADLSTFKLDVEIDEIDINRIAIDQPVIIALDSIPDEEYHGRVDEIAVSPVSSVSGGIVAYKVSILVDSQEAPFRIGMNVNATIETERLEDIVLLENRAIEIDRSDGKAYVEKLEADQSIVRTEVTLGLRDNRASQILSGLEEGDTVVIREQSRREQLRDAFAD